MTCKSTRWVFPVSSGITEFIELHKQNQKESKKFNPGKISYLGSNEKYLESKEKPNFILDGNFCMLGKILSMDDFTL